MLFTPLTILVPHTLVHCMYICIISCGITQSNVDRGRNESGCRMVASLKGKSSRIMARSVSFGSYADRAFNLVGPGRTNDL